ncbi:ATP-grasp domain-containing protein [Actinomadura madurae]|uniref:ATP-grasp domain-containing protein n=2 Tax=Actinomadura madurae TaxID=1993 RepID=A0A1I5PFF5_9ACTN|nr:ATP-grasp domain-containing protein [Actinomadura madurae]SPT63909.1 Uncharacterised protein [Actinomadura madurae]
MIGDLGTQTAPVDAGGMTESPSPARVFALLTDGTQVEIKRLGEADRDAVRDLHRGLSEKSLSALLLGHPARPAGDVPGLRDALLRMSRLVADHPEIAELDLNPTIVRPDGVVAVDARVRLAPGRAWDPYLRRLR